MITIIIPVYNAGKIIKYSIDSIRKQSYSDWSLICVDDGSTDNSLHVLHEYEKVDKRIIVLSQKNAGAEAARKKGVMHEVAQHSEFIMFCDADDLIPAYALEKMISVAEKYNCDLVCGNTDKLFRNITFKNRYQPPCFNISKAEQYDKKRIEDELLISFYGVSNFPVSLWGKIFRTPLITEAIKGERIVKYMGEDLCVTLRLMIQIENCVIIPDIVYHYRIGGGTSKYNENYMRDFINLYNYKLKIAEQLNIPQDWRYYMNVELLNTTKTFCQLCINDKTIRENRLAMLIKELCKNQTIQNAAEYLLRMKQDMNYAGYFLAKDYRSIINYNKTIVNRNRFKQNLKRLIFLLQ